MDLSLLDSLLQAAASQGDKTLAEQYRKAMEGSKGGRRTALLFGALHAFPDSALLEAALSQSIPLRIGLPNLMPVLLRVMANTKLRKILVDALFREREALLASGGTAAKRQENFEQAAQLFAVLCNREGIALAKRFAGQEFDPTPFLGAIEGCIAFAAKTQQSATAAFSHVLPSGTHK